MSTRSRVLALIAALIAAYATALFPVAHADEGVATCTPARVPTGTLEVAGTLCVPGPEGTTPHTVLVLVPGATYNHVYWDADVDPATYNFRAAMNRGGYATFVLDRLGTGASSRPPSAVVTADRQAQAIHVVVGALRAGRAGLPAVDSVVLGGHSLGTTMVVLEAARYRDVDAVLLSGFSHAPNAVGLGALFASLTPVGLDVGYLTTRPGTRDALYGRGDVTPEVAAYDERTKDVVSVSEVPVAATTLLPVTPGVTPPALQVPATAGIAAPVLLVNGTDDKQFCGPPLGHCTSDADLAAAELPFFPSAPSFEARVVAGSGHDLALSRNAPEFQQTVVDWLQRIAPDLELTAGTG
jgi:pimeloyl-ACP methyl ester carboxylesterase